MQFSHLWNLLKTTAPFWTSSFLAGVIAAFVVHLLTQSRERQRWILDAKKQEFKELLTAIAESYLPTLRTRGSDFFQTLIAEPDQQELSRLKANAFRVFKDRLYVNDDLDLGELSNDWMIALNAHDVGSLHEAYSRISEAVVLAANQSAPKTTKQKLKFWKR